MWQARCNELGSAFARLFSVVFLKFFIFDDVSVGIAADEADAVGCFVVGLIAVTAEFDVAIVGAVKIIGKIVLALLFKFIVVVVIIVALAAIVSAVVVTAVDIGVITVVVSAVIAFVFVAIADVISATSANFSFVIVVDVPGVGIVAVEADAVGSVVVGVTVIAVFGGFVCITALV